MKKFIFVLVAVLAMSSMAMAGTIAGTKHDFSTTGPAKFSSNSTEICVHCHTPHMKAGAAYIPYTPLWNRSTNNTTSFTPFTSSTLSAGNQKSNPFTLTTVSIACLTCHDGSLSNSGSAGGPVTNAANPTITYAAGAWSANSNFGSDLSDVHPIAVSLATASAAKAAEYNGTSSDAAIVLFNGLVECASCHNPHDDTNMPFLARSNAASAICAACHRY